MSGRSGPSKKLLGLELTRGLAALLVLFYHIDKFYFGSTKYWSGPVFGGLFKFGHAGVEFFFVLSGFIMYFIHRGDPAGLGSAKNFLAKRLVRIYPLLWVCTLGLLSIYLAMPGAGRAIYRSPLLIAESLALIGRDPLNAIDFPSWTLWHENVFYAFCFVTILLPRIGSALFIAWSAVCLVLGLTSLNEASLFYMVQPINGLFLFGVAVAMLRERGVVAAPVLMSAIGAAAFLALGVYSNGHAVSPPLLHYAFGLASAVLIWGLCSLKIGSGSVFGRLCAFSGTISYPLYLTHMLSLPIIMKALSAAHVTTRVPAPAGFLAITLLAVLFAYAVHRLIEAPMMRAARIILPGRSPAAAAATRPA